jgi:hypothetical protein
MFVSQSIATTLILLRRRERIGSMNFWQPVSTDKVLVLHQSDKV